MQSPDTRPSLAAEITRAEAATGGEWFVKVLAEGYVVQTSDGRAVADTWFLENPATGNRGAKFNADFIAHARTVCPKALRLLHRIREQAKEAECFSTPARLLLEMIEAEFAE